MRYSANAEMGVSQIELVVALPLAGDGMTVITVSRKLGANSAASGLGLALGLSCPDRRQFRLPLKCDS